MWPEWRNGRRRGLKSRLDRAAGQRFSRPAALFVSEQSEEGVWFPSGMDTQVDTSVLQRLQEGGSRWLSARRIDAEGSVGFVSPQHEDRVARRDLIHLGCGAIVRSAGVLAAAELPLRQGQREQSQRLVRRLGVDLERHLDRCQRFLETAVAVEHLSLVINERRESRTCGK